MNALGKNVASVALTLSLAVLSAACDTSGMGGLGEAGLGGGGFQPAGGGAPSGGGSGGNIVGRWGIDSTSGFALAFNPDGRASIMQWEIYGGRFVFEIAVGQYRVSGNQVEMMMQQSSCRSRRPSSLRFGYQVRGDQLIITIDGKQGSLGRDVFPEYDQSSPVGCIDENGNFTAN